MHILFILAGLWNRNRYPEEEKELRREGRKNHLILGRNKDGSIRSIRVEGAFADALEWFGLDDYPADIADLRAGRKTVADEAAEMVKSPIERGVGSLEPFTKTIYELSMGRSTF